MHTHLDYRLNDRCLSDPTIYPFSLFIDVKNSNHIRRHSTDGHAITFPTHQTVQRLIRSQQRINTVSRMATHRQALWVCLVKWKAFSQARHSEIDKLGGGGGLSRPGVLDSFVFLPNANAVVRELFIAMRAARSFDVVESNHSQAVLDARFDFSGWWWTPPAFAKGRE